MNELRFIHCEGHNNFLKAVERTGIEDVEESMWFSVSSKKLYCYIQNKDEKVQSWFFLLLLP